MPTTAEKHQAIIESVTRNYRILQGLDSNHELLSCIHNVDEFGFNTKEELIGKYDPEGTATPAEILSHYNTDLSRAVKELEDKPSIQ